MEHGAAARRKTLSAILFGMLLVGVLFAPDTTGRDRAETQQSSTRRQRFTRTEQAEEPFSASP